MSFRILRVTRGWEACGLWFSPSGDWLAHTEARTKLESDVARNTGDQLEQLITRAGWQDWERIMLTHRWVAIDPIAAGHHPLYGIAGWLPWVLFIAIAGPTWVFWQGLSVDALQLAGADLFNAKTPGSGAINVTTLLYLISSVTVLVLATTYDGAFRLATIAHMALLPPLIGLILMAGSVPGARTTFIDGVVVAIALTLTCGVYLQASRRVHITFELRDRAPGEHAWFKRQKQAAAG
jgi:hypothetical protein